MLPWTNLLAWIACVVYSTIPSFWLLIHPFAERWRSRKRSPYVVLLPIWVAMWMIVAAITAPWRNVALYAARWPWIPALALFTLGFWLYSQSLKHFSALQLGGTPELTAGTGRQKLVTSGIRARVRHPVYLAHLCEMFAWSIGTGVTICYGLTAFAVLTGAIMIQMEDKELQRRFGAEYAVYKKRVPAFRPRMKP
jgi:protein-S-isoprenylcysteine O-methyltransferase Ste14